MTREGQDKIYQAVTDKMVTALEAGTIPWRQGWTSGMSLPRSMSTRKLYRGINTWILFMTAAEKGYQSSWWGTYDQIAELSGMEVARTIGKRKVWRSPDGTPRGVRAGEKGELVIWWGRVKIRDTENLDENGRPTIKRIPVLRYFKVWNAEQADGLPARFYPKPGADGAAPAEVAGAEVILKDYFSREGAPAVVWDGRDPVYRPSADKIHLPRREQFTDASHLYSTTFHEMTHSTGHKSRLRRPGFEAFGGHDRDTYGKEELCAEMGAAFLTAMTGTDDHFDTDHAAYVGNWLKTIKGDHKLVVQAAAQAQKATDYILGIEYEKDTEED